MIIFWISRPPLKTTAKYSGTILRYRNCGRARKGEKMIVFTCYDTFDDMMTCIYDAWAARLGHSNIRLQTEPLGNLELFCEYRHIDADREKVRKVIRSIQNKISYQAFYDVYAASLSCESNKLDIIYRFLIIGFLYQKQTTQMLGNPAVASLFELKRKEQTNPISFVNLYAFPDSMKMFCFLLLSPNAMFLPYWLLILKTECLLRTGSSLIKIV